MTYRNATHEEAEAIADLHAKSWQTAYRGILSDDFLSGYLGCTMQYQYASM